MIDLEDMKKIGIREYLLKNQMITGLEHKRKNIELEFEFGSQTKVEEEKEDTRLYNLIKNTNIYMKITEELKNNKDNEVIPNKDIDYQTKKNFLDITPPTNLAPTTKSLVSRGNKISSITKMQREQEEKEKIRRQFEAMLRQLNKKNRMDNITYRNYLLYLIENMDILDANEMKKDLKLIRNVFTPSELAKSWEKKEEEKDGAVHILNRKRNV